MKSGARDNRRNSTVTYFPYAPGMNPYQSMFRQALEVEGVTVRPEPPHKWFPLRLAASRTADVLQVDWIHDLYTGRNVLTSITKRFMYADGLRAIRRIPVVWTVHNLVAHDSMLEATAHVRILQRFVDECDGLLFLSKASEVEFRDLYDVPDDVVTIASHIGHFIDCYPNGRDPIAARRLLGIPTEARVAACVGRLHPYKGFEDLIAAFGHIATERDVLLIAGKPSSEAFAARLQALAAQTTRGKGIRVMLKLGIIPDAAMQHYFNAADFAVLPFRSILNSASALLAVGYGVPLLAPALGSMPEHVSAELGALYQDKELEAALASMFTRCEGGHLLDRSERIELVRQRFAWKDLAVAACSIYASVWSTVQARAKGL